MIGNKGSNLKNPTPLVFITVRTIHYKHIATWQSETL